MDIISAFRHSSLSSIQGHSDTLYIYIHNIVSIAALFHSHFAPPPPSPFLSLSIYAKWWVHRCASTSKCRSVVEKACELSLQKFPLLEKLFPLIFFYVWRKYQYRFFTVMCSVLNWLFPGIILRQDLKQ